MESLKGKKGERTRGPRWRRGREVQLYRVGIVLGLGDLQGAVVLKEPLFT